MTRRRGRVNRLLEEIVAVASQGGRHFCRWPAHALSTLRRRRRKVKLASPASKQGYSCEAPMPERAGFCSHMTFVNRSLSKHRVGWPALAFSCLRMGSVGWGGVGQGSGRFCSQGLVGRFVFGNQCHPSPPAASSDASVSSWVGHDSVEAHWIPYPVSVFKRDRRRDACKRLSPRCNRKSPRGWIKGRVSPSECGHIWPTARARPTCCGDTYADSDEK
jgi:hypothetical protein